MTWENLQEDIAAEFAAFEVAQIETRDRRLEDWARYCLTQRRAYHEAHRFETNARSRQWYAANKVHAKQRAQRYNKEHAAQIQATTRAWRARNIEHDAARKHAYYLAHRDKVLSNKHAYYATHRDEINAKRRKQYRESTKKR